MNKIQSILCLDDDLDFINIIKSFCNTYEYNLTATTSLDEFIQKVKNNEYDLLLIDLNIDNVEGAGFYTIKEVRTRLLNNTPIFVISSFTDPHLIDQALDLGAKDYITKPLDQVLLESKIQFYKIDRNDNTLLKYYIVSEQLRNCELHVEHKISKITEDGLVILSSDYIAKGSHVKIRGEVFKDILGEEIDLKMSVKNIVKSKNSMYEVFLEFQDEENEEKERFRIWILSQKRKINPLSYYL